MLRLLLLLFSLLLLLQLLLTQHCMYNIEQICLLLGGSTPTRMPFALAVMSWHGHILLQAILRYAKATLLRQSCACN